MSTAAVIALVVIVILALLVAAILAAAARKRRTDRLRGEFGNEYDRTLDDAGKRRTAEKDLAARKEEHAELELRPLSAAARERYTASWTQVQARFVDSPVLAVSEADALVTELMNERGYPTDEFDSQARLLSVEHGHVLESYRSAHAVELESRTQRAGTEDIRNAMLDFRRVFEDVMGEAASDNRVLDVRDDRDDRDGRVVDVRGDEHQPTDGTGDRDHHLRR
jgi:hypothetical protein